MLTVMSLSAAREGALLPGRNGNRVRLGREGDAVTEVFAVPSRIRGPQQDLLP